VELRLISLLILAITCNSLFAETLISCRGLGGAQHIDGSCYCETTKQELDLSSNEFCFEKAISLVFKENKKGENVMCPSSTFIPTADSYLVEHEQFCKNPMPYLCSSLFNPKINKIDQAREEFTRLEDAVLKSPSYIEYNQKHYKVDSCRDLEDLQGQQYIKCVKYYNELLSEKLYTEKRKEKAEMLLEHAKRLILFELSQRKILTQKLSIGQEDKQRRLDELEYLEKAVSSIKPYFGVIGSDTQGNSIVYDLYSSNARHESQYLGGAKRGYHNLIPHDENTVFIAGMVTLVDHSPDEFLRFLIHEVAHTIDPNRLLVDGQTTYSFQEEIACLMREDTIGAKVADLNCLHISLEKYQGEERESIKRVMVHARKNPFGHFIEALPAGVKCSQGQIGESFSDYLGAKAITRSLALDKEYDTNFGIREIKGLNYIDIMSRIDKYPQLGKLGLAFCNTNPSQQGLSRNDHHGAASLERDRLKLLFAEPEIQQMSGCDNRYVFDVKSLNDPIVKGKVGRCSEKLIGGR
jgi:hypothetical protein